MVLFPVTSSDPNHSEPFYFRHFVSPFLSSQWMEVQKAHLVSRYNSNKYVHLRGRPYIHTCLSYVHTPRHFTNGASLARRIARALTELQIERRSDVCQPRPAGEAKLQFVRFWAYGKFWGAKFPKMGDSLLRTPMNSLAKFDVAGFILSGEICNRTNTHTNKHTNKQTVNNTSTPCLSACVDKRWLQESLTCYA